MNKQVESALIVIGCVIIAGALVAAAIVKNHMDGSQPVVESSYVEPCGTHPDAPTLVMRVTKHESGVCLRCAEEWMEQQGLEEVSLMQTTDIAMSLRTVQP